MPRKALLILVTVLALSLAVFHPGVSKAETSTVQIDNDYIRIVVNNQEANMGRFSVGTTGGDPNRDTDQNKHLIYGGDDPWTSYTTVRVDNQNWIFGSPTDRRAGFGGRYGEMVQPPTIVDETIQSSWLVGPVQVWQILSITRSSTTGLLDTAQIEYHVENTDSVSHMVGMRLMLDTMLGSNDGAPFRIEDRGLTTDTVRYSQDMPHFWQAFDSLANPQVMSQGTLTGPGVTHPDRVYFTNWGSLADQPWNFDFQPGRDYMRTGEFELDSAIAVFWDQLELGPGESRSFVSQYGLGGVTIAPGDLVLGVTSPAFITADTEGMQTYSITAYVENTGEGDALDVVAEVKLPQGLELVGSPSKIKLGDLKVNETTQTGWAFRVKSGVEGVLTYEVEVTATNSKPNKVRRNVEVLTPARLRVLLTGPPMLSIKEEKYDPASFEVIASIKNEGGTPAYSAFVEILSTTDLDLVGDQGSKRFMGTIEPGKEINASWVLRPTGTPGNIRYLISVNAERINEVKYNNVIIPELNERIWIGPPSTGETPLEVGDYFSIPVWATNFYGFLGATVDLSFDPNVVEVVGKTLGISRGTLFVDDAPGNTAIWQLPIVSNKDGKITGLKGRLDTPLARSFGTLATIHFRAIGAGQTGIKVNSVEVETFDGIKTDVGLPGYEQVIIKPRL